MPLHARDPVGVPSPFDAFNRTVRSTRGNAQIPARLLNRLMVRTVDYSLGVSGKRAQAASVLERGSVSGIFFWFWPAFRRQVFLLMGRCCASFDLKILNQRATQVDVQELAAVANSQDRLSFCKSVPQNGTVRPLPSHVGRSR